MRLDEHELLNMLPRLRRYARALVRHKEEADDLVQDTLERAWLKSSLWRGVADMRGWLFSIMHNLHADGVRLPRIHTVELDDNTPEIPIAARQGEQLAMRDLQAALNQLPDEQREVLLLVALEEMAYADIAKTLNIPIGTVMSRLSRGRERLRIVLEAQDKPVRLKIVK
ncbi:RNA polymerase sigma factor [Iodobacter sp.]|uniref:RNA polymerase sigma factor n=1 Tax=Iodobacter sp. TaxID=1915058 RepID=UPI0025E216C9|nr:sigma-70 family RNA polymerase sigma factor [Iodobacter sp.]